MMTPDQILDGLDDRFRLLTRAGDGSVPRHQTLAASMDWSYELLPPEEQVLLGRLSVFADSFSLEAAGVVTGDDQVVDRLGRLVARSLVQVDPRIHRPVDQEGGGHARYRLLETIRAYGHDRLVESGDLDAIRHRHLDWAAALVAQAEPELDTSRQPGWLVRLELEHANLAEALAHARRHRPTTALSMAAGLSLFWKLRGHFGEARDTLRALLDETEELAGSAGPPRRAARWALADVCYWMGDLDQAVAEAERSRDEGRQAGDLRLEGRARWTLGMARSLFDGGQARLDGLAAIELAVAVGDRWLEVVARQVVGVLARLSGDTAEARRELGAALALSEGHDVPQLLACSWSMVQWLEVDAGHFDAADHGFRVGMAGAELILDPATPGYLADAQGEALHWRGRIHEARTLLERSTAELCASGARVYEPFLHHRLAVTLVGTDDGAAAAEVARILDVAQPAVGHTLYDALARGWLGLAGGDPGAARTAADLALDLARLVGPRVTVEHLVVAGLARLPDDPVDAAERFQEALGLAHDSGLAPWIPEALDGLAATLALRGLDVDAARLLGAADRARQELGTVRLPGTGQIIGPIEAASRARAGADHTPARMAGTELTVGQALLVARRNRGRRRRPATGWDSLTPAEEQVVGLAADGLTNAQIAARLFVSPGTVKTHLAHAFAKLGVTNRTELATRRAGRT